MPLPNDLNCSWKQKRTNMKWVACCALIGFSGAALAESAARASGRAVGEFGAGVGEVVGQGVARSVANLQPEWITIPPRSKEECIAEAGGVIDSIYMRCRNGRQEYVRYDENGRKRVLSERPIPVR
jgi:hypothetical protein